MLKPNEPHTFGFPSVSPDIALATGAHAATSKQWRHPFGEVKPSKMQGPKPATAGTIPPIVTQCADYARLFMFARPFMLFCVVILVFGTEFCVGIFDRDGVTFSPIYDMFEATDVFIRVVRSLACDLSVEELGHDPTVRVLDDQETKELSGLTEYASAVVSSGGNDPRKWCTIGPPIWTSLSLLGRATNVWRVREYVLDATQSHLRGAVRILKTAWRSSARTPESDIYSSILPGPRGVAAFECGGDVKFPGRAGLPITVQNLRGDGRQNLPREDIDPPTPVLHRLVLGTVGRPMWEYKSDRDLLMGFRDALEAHRALCEKGILYRDISAGNILLTETQDDGLYGFITDLEFARVENSIILKRPAVTLSNLGQEGRHSDHERKLSATEATRQHTTHESTAAVKRGATMTGTAQFMAREILMSRGRERVVVHQPAHDVESFIWVLSFCVMRKIQLLALDKLLSPKEARDQCKAFRRIFGQATPKLIAGERHSVAPALMFHTDPDIDKIIANFMSATLVALFDDLQDLIHEATSRTNPTVLTHDHLLALVNKAIMSLPL